jgi:hypothetical protein
MATRHLCIRTDLKDLRIFLHNSVLTCVTAFSITEHKMCRRSLLHPILLIRSSHPLLFDFPDIWWSVEIVKVSLYGFLQPPFVSSLLGPENFFSRLFFYTSSLCPLKMIYISVRSYQSIYNLIHTFYTKCENKHNHHNKTHYSLSHTLLTRVIKRHQLTCPIAEPPLLECWQVLSPTRKETSYSDRRFWCSYILFIIIIGGILVLFIYITRLASNEIFSPSKKIHREVGRAKDLSAQ